ncbi:two-component system, OmpR family, response regulator [Bradyrhizobium sp. Rc2d]|nr:two-component system, OmpR family, response regulator [Bradyrhizobium sp. Rc2d]
MTGGYRRILVVEDDPETAGELKDQLTISGYQVDLASSGSEALSHGAAHNYAVITIDRMLPDIDGIAVMCQLRDGGVAAPFLIISALGEVDDKVRGLRAGGDDYLVKPFSFLELLARLEALGRRSDAIAEEAILRVGDLTIDLISRTVSRRGKEILLLPKEFQIINIWCATKTASCRGRWCCSTSGIFISIHRISLMSMSDGCAARWTTSKPIR